MNNKINLSRILLITTAATIIAGMVFIVQYPRYVTRYALDTQRLIEAQDLEQALEWYLIRQAGAQEQAAEDVPAV